MAWKRTSSKRAVLSARSMKVPSRRKRNASSCSMVPSATPRDRCERYLTHSKNLAGSVSNFLALNSRFISSQVRFCVSHASVVNAPRTARAFSRAACRQL
ncbi:hypothetical protein D3C71_1663250 [compost metagenome]